MTEKKRSRWLSIGVLIVVLILYQAPNLALLAYKAGLPLANTDQLGVQVKVRNGWYPVASSDSLLGKAAFPPAGPPLVAFHRPSLIWPWTAETFALMSYRKPVDAAAVESTKEMPWGRAMLIKANPVANPAQRLFAVPDLGVGVLLENPNVLDDIVALARVQGSPKVP